MSYTTLKKEIDDNIKKNVRPLPGYLRDYLTKPIQEERKKLSGTGEYVAFLYNDLIDDNKLEETEVKMFLGDNYESTNDHAKKCVGIAKKTVNLFNKNIADWVFSALKCFDNFLLALIQDEDKLNEKIPQNEEEKRYETEKYILLKRKKTGDYRAIGKRFLAINEVRNKFVHLEIPNKDLEKMKEETPSRRIYQKKFKHNELTKIIKEVLTNFKIALITLEKQIKYYNEKNKNL